MQDFQYIEYMNPNLMESDQKHMESKGGHKSESNQHSTRYLKSKNFKESNQIIKRDISRITRNQIKSKDKKRYIKTQL